MGRRLCVFFSFVLLFGELYLSNNNFNVAVCLWFFSWWMIFIAVVATVACRLKFVRINRTNTHYATFAYSLTLSHTRFDSCTVKLFFFFFRFLFPSFASKFPRRRCFCRQVWCGFNFNWFTQSKQTLATILLAQNSIRRMYFQQKIDNFMSKRVLKSPLVAFKMAADMKMTRTKFLSLFQRSTVGTYWFFGSFFFLFISRLWCWQAAPHRDKQTHWQLSEQIEHYIVSHIFLCAIRRCWQLYINQSLCVHTLIYGHSNH